jgi:hypothetical protein
LREKVIDVAFSIHQVDALYIAAPRFDLIDELPPTKRFTLRIVGHLVPALERVFLISVRQMRSEKVCVQVRAKTSSAPLARPSQSAWSSA